jgi:hypothetical protein
MNAKTTKNTEGGVFLYNQKKYFEKLLATIWLLRPTQSTDPIGIQFGYSDDIMARVR